MPRVLRIIKAAYFGASIFRGAQNEAGHLCPYPMMLEAKKVSEMGCLRDVHLQLTKVMISRCVMGGRECKIFMKSHLFFALF